MSKRSYEIAIDGLAQRLGAGGGCTGFPLKGPVWVL